jgi:hypothetical protein
MHHDHGRRERREADLSGSESSSWLKPIRDYRERLVTVVSHFLGGSAPELVTGVVSRCDTGRGVGWASRPLPGPEKRRGDLPCGISPLLTEFPEDPASATRSQLCSPGVCSALAGFTPRHANDPVIPGAAKASSPPSGDFQFPGSSMSFVADTREAAGLLSSGKITLPLRMIMARESTAGRALFVCKSTRWCGNGGGESGHATKREANQVEATPEDLGPVRTIARDQCPGSVFSQSAECFSIAILTSWLRVRTPAFWKSS